MPEEPPHPEPTPPAAPDDWGEEVTDVSADPVAAEPSRLAAALGNIPRWAWGALAATVAIALLGIGIYTFWGSPDKTIAETPPSEPVELPSDLAAPKPPQPVATRPAELELTPEQTLIAAIQAQVATVTDEYAEGLIQYVEANFRDSRLLVAVSSQWFELPASEQERLSQEMLARSRRLDFDKLYVRDADGNLLARHPVVGDEVVILRR